MNTNNYPVQNSASLMPGSNQKNFRFSFSSFQKAIRSNSEARKQIEDIVDLGLFDFMLRQNTIFIQAVREKAEAETIELTMRFAYGIDDYQKLKKMIHRNRIIRTLAIMDLRANLALINKFNHFIVATD
ncbi:MAG: hypothetical protein Q7U54_06680 [Bacteroidales bacterium]|nr:hypothetical protein [Bacteroidales bacterium]